jgi:putative alpha-1,2-mannosidase
MADDTSLPDPYYWHGNEPDLHYAYLGSLAGAPEVTADAVRWIRDHRYADEPVGLDGNDDSGTLSAWLLWSAIGVFPVAGTTTYAIGSPWFERAEIDLPDGEMLVVRAQGVSDDARTVTRATVGGEEIAAATLDHSLLLSGGELVFEMSEDP